MENFDISNEVFDAELEALFTALYQKCKELGVPSVLSIMRGSDGDTENYATAITVREGMLPDRFKIAYAAIDSDSLGSMPHPDRTARKLMNDFRILLAESLAKATMVNPNILREALQDMMNDLRMDEEGPTKDDTIN